MAIEPEEGKCLVFNNKYKEEGDNKPDFKGKILINGEEKDVALWKRNSDAAGDFFSMAVKDAYKPEAIEEDKKDALPF